MNRYYIEVSGLLEVEAENEEAAMDVAHREMGKIDINPVEYGDPEDADKADQEAKAKLTK